MLLFWGLLAAHLLLSDAMYQVRVEGCTAGMPCPQVSGLNIFGGIDCACTYDSAGYMLNPHYRP